MAAIPQFPSAEPAGTFTALIGLAERLTAIVAAETAALKTGDRAAFEALTPRKAEYSAVLQQSLVALEPQRTKASVPDRERWAGVAAACETALQENAKVIAGEQVHAAAMLDSLRQMLRQRQASTLGYGRDARPRSKD